MKMNNYLGHSMTMLITSIIIKKLPKGSFNMYKLDFGRTYKIVENYQINCEWLMVAYF